MPFKMSTFFHSDWCSFICAHTYSSRWRRILAWLSVIRDTQHVVSLHNVFSLATQHWKKPEFGYITILSVNYIVHYRSSHGNISHLYEKKVSCTQWDNLVNNNELLLTPICWPRPATGYTLMPPTGHLTAHHHSLWQITKAVHVAPYP